MRTLTEKYNYNKSRRDFDPFSLGYCFGVDLYRDYARTSAIGKKTIIELIDLAKKSCLLTREDFKRGHPLDEQGIRDNGILCGYRDAANERKRAKPIE